MQERTLFYWIFFSFQPFNNQYFHYIETRSTDWFLYDGNIGR